MKPIRTQFKTVATATLVSLLLLVSAALATAGGLDSSFGQGGLATVPTSSPLAVTDLAQARPDGAMVAAVRSWQRGGSAFVGARFGADGSLDRNFGGDGLVEVSAGGSLGQTVQATAAASLSSGRSLVVGYRTRSSGRDLRTAPLLVRLLADGSFDPGFGSNGVVAPHFTPGGGDSLYAVAPAKGGRILAVGARNEIAGGGPAGLVTAYRSDGRVDRTFGKDGRVLFPAPRMNQYTGLSGVKVLKGGRILVSGYRHGRLFAARLSRDGTLDRDFGGGDGTVSLTVGDTQGCNAACGPRTAMAVVGGRILILGTQSNARTVLVRLRADGRVDRSFGRDGFVDRATGKRLTNPYDFAIQGNGRILVTGADSRVAAGGQIYFVLGALRFMPDGRPDRSFGSSGFYSLSRSRSSAAFAAVTQPDGEVVVGGGKGPAEEGGAALLLTRFEGS